MFGHISQINPRKRRMYLALFAFLLISLLHITPATRAQTLGDTFFTKSIDENTYGIYIKQGALAPRVMTTRDVSTNVSDYTVPVIPAPNGQRLALINNYNAIYGSDLQVVPIVVGRAGEPTQVVADKVTSAAWSPDSSRLAYTVLRDNQVVVFIWQEGQPLLQVATFNANWGNMIGWSSAGNVLFLAHSLDTSDAAGYQKLTRINLTTGGRYTIFTSAAGGPIYTDFRLVQLPDGTQRVSAIKNSTDQLCVGTASMILADPLGAVLKTTPELKNIFSNAIWSGETQVVYEKRVCADKSEGADGLSRIESNNGLYVENVDTRAKTQLTQGLFDDYRATGFDGATVRLSAPTLGIYELSTSTSSPKTDVGAIESQDPDGGVPDGVPTYGGGTVVVNNPAPYIHQLWDTPDAFNGTNACGPTSAVMALAGKKLPQWPITVNALAPGRTSNYGNYIPTKYTYNGYTFQASWNDPSGHPAQGAYGYIVGSSGADWGWLTKYLGKHVGDTNVQQVTPGGAAPGGGIADGAWLRSQLLQGKVVVASTWITPAGHLLLIKGFTYNSTNPDNPYKYIVHDPYGKRASRLYDGKNIRYNWSDIGTKQFWVVTR